MRLKTSIHNKTNLLKNSINYYLSLIKEKFKFSEYAAFIHLLLIFLKRSEGNIFRFLDAINPK